MYARDIIQNLFESESEASDVESADESYGKIIEIEIRRFTN